MSEEFDLDGCGERETLQLLKLSGSNGFAMGIRVIKNGEIFDLEDNSMLQETVVNMWLADLDSDDHAELYLILARGTVQQKLLAWEFSKSGMQRLQFEEESISAAAVHNKR